MFVDEAEIDVSAGRGGDGAVSLRHEKFVPRGGPDGGDGGAGGSVTAVGEARLRTLIDVSFRKHFNAEHGRHGGPNRRTGKRGKHVTIRLPIGTVIRDLADNSVVADLTHDGQEIVLARGGRGGRGNASFATSTRQTPRFAEKGEPGESRRLGLELKLLADVGLLGLPNVGKSSFIARVSAARPKIANYPFTTLVPNLGVVRMEESVSFVIADLPGLVEGAHRGVGRGHDFLRHAERTHLLIHMLDVSVPDRDPLEDFRVLNTELARYSASLAARPQLVALNKIDLRPPPERLDHIEEILRQEGQEVFRISALTGEGVRPLLGRTVQFLSEEAPQQAEEVPAEVEVGEKPLRPLQVSRINENQYQVSGNEVERTVVMTDLENEEAVRYLHRKLERMGVIAQLRSLGAKDGDRVSIADIELDFVD
ncbi:MAG: GTPase ObgE [Armatimonadetes bacterium]|nr:GTPase ObgE [Armatimonadota bacterium]